MSVAPVPSCDSLTICRFVLKDLASVNLNRLKRITNPGIRFGACRAPLLAVNGREGTDMKTGDTVTDLGLYTSECCSAELIFNTGDRFLGCPNCRRPCLWELEEELVTPEDFERINTVAA